MTDRGSNVWAYDFFLAHAGPDKGPAEELYEFLSAATCRVFLDTKSLKLGDDWDHALATAQRASCVTIVLISNIVDEAFYQREEIARAIELARGNEGHRVVPLYLDAESATVAPYGLRVKHGLVIGGDLPLAEAAAKLLDLRVALSSDVKPQASGHAEHLAALRTGIPASADSDPIIPALYVGVDSGGTRTNVTLRFRYPDGVTKDHSYGVEDSLSGALAGELIPSTMRNILERLEGELSKAEIPITEWKVPIYLWISAAGFTPWTRDDYLASMSDLLPNLLGGAVRGAGAANDGVSLLLGSRADGIIIAGTGSTVLLRGRGGELHQAGGHEWVACDDGAGFWIAVKAIRRAYRDLESGIDSVLLQRIRETYRVRDDSALIRTLRDLAVASKDMKKDIAHFAASVCWAAEHGDIAAQDIVKGEAEALADVTAEGLRRWFSARDLAEGVSLVQCGGLISNELYRVTFEGQLGLRLHGGDPQKVRITWQRVITGGEAALQLAADLVKVSEPLRRLDWEFRPAIAEL